MHTTITLLQKIHDVCSFASGIAKQFIHQVVLPLNRVCCLCLLACYTMSVTIEKSKGWNMWLRCHRGRRQLIFQTLVFWRSAYESFRYFSIVCKIFRGSQFSNTDRVPRKSIYLEQKCHFNFIRECHLKYMCSIM